MASIQSSKQPFVPSWIRIWHIINLFVLIPDWTYIYLRPRSQEGGDLAWLFPIFNIYARFDSLFRDSDRAVGCIYLISVIDILIIIFLCTSFQLNARKPWYALLVIVRAVFVMCKTLLYVLYSVPFIAPNWRFPILFMNSQWIIVPVIVALAVSRRVVQALDSVLLKEE